MCQYLGINQYFPTRSSGYPWVFGDLFLVLSYAKNIYIRRAISSGNPQQYTCLPLFKITPIVKLIFSAASTNPPKKSFSRLEYYFGEPRFDSRPDLNLQFFHFLGWVNVPCGRWQTIPVTSLMLCTSTMGDGQWGWLWPCTMLILIQLAS